MNIREALLERFLRYVRINTCSDENSETVPSTAHQFDLASVLADEMKAMGLSDVFVDAHCYVYGKLPATKGYEAIPALGFIAHMDTVSEFCDGLEIHPLLHENYDGGDIVLRDSGRRIKVQDFPHLKGMAGRTIITSDGRTVLGADDKAGIAEIMTMADRVISSGAAHGTLCFAFTPDEEIGSGADLLDLKRFGAVAAYTVDGGPEGTLEYENFNAATAKIDICGVNVHPGDAKDVMVNAAVLAAEFHGMLPKHEQPRYTEGYEGFYHLIGMRGSCASAHLSYIIRDHDREIFEKRKQTVFAIAKKLNGIYGEDCVSVEVTDSYYNMKEVLKDHMDLIDKAFLATEAEGVLPQVIPIRGGTDGARLSFRGLPCPNLGTGGYAFHGPYEHISLEGMEKAAGILYRLAVLG